MGQHKMEKDFSKKLNQREITPSAQAWDRLDAMLTVAEETKPKRNLGWLYTAAAILGFLFLGTLYFNRIPEVKDVARTPVVIESNSSQKPSNAKETIVGKTPDFAIAMATTVKTRAAIKTPTKKTESHSIQINDMPEKRDVIAQNRTTNESIITQAKSELAVGNQKMAQPNVPADELLSNAPIIQKASAAQNSIKVNPKNLLSEVDGEVNLSFREKMLHTINKNYKEVAEAVSNRNIQQ